jgi:hypothetical protein
MYRNQSTIKIIHTILAKYTAKSIYIYIYIYQRRWEDNIKRDLQEVGGGCGDWMERAQDRDRWREIVSTVMNFRVP